MWEGSVVAGRKSNAEKNYMNRLERHHDELRWLYMELYDNSSMFAELTEKMKDFCI